MRWLGWQLAVIPWLIAPGTLNAYLDLKWPAIAFGLLVFIALRLRECPPRDDARAGGPRFQIRDLIRVGSRSPLIVGFCLICVGLIVSALPSPATWLGLRVGLREMLLAGGAIVIAAAAPTRGEVAWGLRCLIFSSAGQAGLMLMQLAAPGLLRRIPYAIPALGSGRAVLVGTLANPEYAASWLGCCAAISMCLLWIARRVDDDRDLPSRASLTVCLALQLAAIFFSGGRGALLALLGAAGVGTLVRHGMGGRAARNGSNSRLRGLGVVGMLALALAIAWFALPSQMRRGMLPDRLADVFDPHSTSVRHRIGLLVVTSKMIVDHPLLGAGPGRYGAAFGGKLGNLARGEQGIGFWTFADLLRGSYVAEAHCDPLQWWAEYGLLPYLGLLLMASGALHAAFARWRRGEIDPAAAAAALGLLALAINAWVAFPLHEPVRAFTFWTLIGFCASRAGARSDQPGIA